MTSSSTLRLGFVAPIIDAVLFDWGDTLFRSAFDDSILLAGWQAGLAAIGRNGLPSHAEAAARFRDEYLPRISADALDEVDYGALIEELLGSFGVELTADELERFLEAEHLQEIPARLDSDYAHALLDELRARGLALGLVSNVCDPPQLVEADLVWMGLDRRLDTAVFSSRVGKRKPHPAIFEAALEALGVEAERTLFVGDRRYEDVGGAKALGMTCALACWFRVDDGERGVEPDFTAASPADILEIVDGLA
jgi:putative hydrolase of the HAD superfamily